MNKEKHEELATMKGIHFGMRDAPWPCLWFSVDTLRYGALQVLHYEEAAELIKKHHIYKIEDLEGAPCVVECEGNIIKFKDLKK